MFIALLRKIYSHVSYAKAKTRSCYAKYLKVNIDIPPPREIAALGDGE